MHDNPNASSYACIHDAPPSCRKDLTSSFVPQVIELKARNPFHSKLKLVDSSMHSL